MLMNMVTCDEKLVMPIIVVKFSKQKGASLEY